MAIPLPSVSPTMRRVRSETSCSWICQESVTLRFPCGFGSVESVKAVSEIFMPVGGTVVEVNDTINESAESVNQDPYGAGWMIKIKIGNPDEVDKLMSAAEYEEFISSE